MIHLYEAPRVVKFRDRKENGGSQGGGRGVGSYCLIGAGFQLGKMRKFWRWMVVTAAQLCACVILIATELYS